ncbi:MAG: hypothetical protein ACJ8DZ_03335 [Allosphingosinicella sp.]
MSRSKPLLALLAFALSACAAAPAAVPVAARGDPHAAWWAEQSWRYPDAAAAEAAYQALAARQSPWPEWHQVHVAALPAGTRFQMALAPGQGTDRPGAFGTFDRIPDVAWVRRVLAVKVAWKPAIDRVVTYEVVDPLPADTGTVGPQIDADGPAYLPGGGSQLEMAVPAAERVRHLKVIEVRTIR